LAVIDIALWRGGPLADLAGEEFAQGEIARLEELRLVAQERRFEAELVLGRHDAVLPEIEALAARYPAREHLRELQMRTLYLAGRQREALRVYQDTRQELVEQFGLEPGQSLRATEQMILAQDPALMPVAEPGAGRVDVDELRRNAVVLLLELAGPEELLNEIPPIVEGYEGVVRASAVDEVVAVFGPPRPHDDDTLRALRADAAVRAVAPPGASVRSAIERLAGDEGTINLDVARRLLAKARPGDLMLGPAALRLVPAAVDAIQHESGEGFRVIRFDYYGRGWSDRIDTVYDQDLFVRQMAGLLDSLRVTTPVTLASISYSEAGKSGDRTPAV